MNAVYNLLTTGNVISFTINIKYQSTYIKPILYVDA